MGGFNLSDYNTVAERIIEFRKKHPEGTIQSRVIELPESFADKFIAVQAVAYRTPDDAMPGTGLAWVPVPGATQFTRLSELQNAETAAVGRALINVGAADAKKGFASREEVQNLRSSEGEDPPPKGKSKPKPSNPSVPPADSPSDALRIPEGASPLYGGKLVADVVATKAGQAWLEIAAQNKDVPSELREKFAEALVVARGGAGSGYGEGLDPASPLAAAASTTSGGGA